MKRARVGTCGVLAWMTIGCGAPEPPSTTGGTDETPIEECGRGFVVASSDYQSSNVSLIGLDGDVLSHAFIHSGASPPGLSVALSGDVVLPLQRSAGDDVVLIDRLATSVLTWVDTGTGDVRAQLDVGTGFASNPQDYAAWNDIAFVSRYEKNPTPGSEPFDAGDDILVIDPAVPIIEGRIDLADALEGAAQNALARPSKLIVAEPHLAVLMSMYSPDFASSYDGRLAFIDLEHRDVTHTVTLEGLVGCYNAALSPDALRIAVICSGAFNGQSESDPSSSGVALIELSSTPELVRTIRASQFGSGELPLGFALEWSGRDALLVSTFGKFESEPDHLWHVDLASDVIESVREGDAFSLGEVRCAVGCGTCALADATTSTAVILSLDPEGGASIENEIALAPSIGLPPRYVGRL